MNSLVPEKIPEYDACKAHQYPKVLFCDATKESLCYVCATTPKYSKYYTASIENLKEKTEKCHQECKDRIESLASGMDEIIRRRKEDIEKVYEEISMMMKDVNVFYDKLVEKIENARRSDMKYLETKGKTLMDEMNEDVDTIEQFVEEVNSFKERFDGIPRENINVFTEESYKVMREVEVLEAKKGNVERRCGKTYEMKFLRSDEEFNKDIYRCIESLKEGFVFTELHSSEYLSPDDIDGRLFHDDEEAYEYKGETGFGAREKNYYNQETNSFYTDMEVREDDNPDALYVNLFSITDSQSQRLSETQEDLTCMYKTMKENVEFDTSKRNELTKDLGEKKVEVMNKFSDLITRLYEVRDKIIENMINEFKERNDTFEKTLKEEKILLSESLYAKDQCERIGIWYKYACESWEKSEKPIQEYIQKIGELEQRKNFFAIIKEGVEQEKITAFRVNLVEEGEEVDIAGFIPRVEFVEFNIIGEQTESRARKRAEEEEWLRKEEEERLREEEERLKKEEEEERMREEEEERLKREEEERIRREEQLKKERLRKEEERKKREKWILTEEELKEQMRWEKRMREEEDRLIREKLEQIKKEAWEQLRERGIRPFEERKMRTAKKGGGRKIEGRRGMGAVEERGGPVEKGGRGPIEKGGSTRVIENGGGRGAIVGRKMVPVEKNEGRGANVSNKRVIERSGGRGPIEGRKMVPVEKNEGRGPIEGSTRPVEKNEGRGAIVGRKMVPVEKNEGRGPIVGSTRPIEKGGGRGPIEGRKMVPVEKGGGRGPIEGRKMVPVEKGERGPIGNNMRVIEKGGGRGPIGSSTRVVEKGGGRGPIVGSSTRVVEKGGGIAAERRGGGRNKKR